MLLARESRDPSKESNFLIYSIKTFSYIDSNILTYALKFFIVLNLCA